MEVPREFADRRRIYHDESDPENRKYARFHRQWLAATHTVEELGTDYCELSQDDCFDFVEPQGTLTREQYVKGVHLGDLEEAIKMRLEKDSRPPVVLNVSRFEGDELVPTPSIVWRADPNRVQHCSCHPRVQDCFAVRPGWR
jgi:hypothetical protein